MVHAQSQEPGGALGHDPTRRGGHLTASRSVRDGSSWGRHGRDIGLGGLGRAPTVTAVLTPSHTVTDTGVAFQKAGFWCPGRRAEWTGVATVASGTSSRDSFERIRRF